MPYKLPGRNVLVTGGSRGLGALIAQKFAAEGCNVAVNYNARQDKADEVCKDIERYYRVKAKAIQGDVGIQADCYNLVQTVVDSFGSIDIIISNAGWTRYTKFGDLNACSEADWDKCWAVNCKANLHLMQKAAPFFNENKEGGVFLVTSSVAGIGATGSSVPYSVSKAAGLQLVKCLASTQGPKIRVNAILPGVLLTEWGAQLDREVVQSTIERSFLKKETGLEDCADMYIAAAKNSSLTGQNLQIDCGSMMLGRRPA